MADAMATYVITAGVFVFLVGILFGMRGRRPKGEMASMSHAEAG
jgi:hypothetical protein